MTSTTYYPRYYQTLVGSHNVPLFWSYVHQKPNLFNRKIILYIEPWNVLANLTYDYLKHIHWIYVPCWLYTNYESNVVKVGKSLKVEQTLILAFLSPSQHGLLVWFLYIPILHSSLWFIIGDYKSRIIFYKICMILRNMYLMLDLCTHVP